MMKKWTRINKDILPAVILDNDRGKVGKLLNGVPIDLVANIHKYLQAPYEIIITTSFVDEIKAQLHEMNIYENIIDHVEIDKEISSAYLKKNRRLLHKKMSKRCFIIGTGPTLGELDLHLLKNEDKIMVNHIYNDDKLVKLTPNFWVIADPTFWEQERRFLEPVVDTLKNKLTSTQLVIRDEVLSHASGDLLLEDNIYYYNLDRTRKYEDITIDFAGTLPHFAQNVISVALMLAVYLKYEEIILIGCDHSWWGYSEEEIDNGVVPPHYYQENEKNVEFFSNSLKNLGYQKLQETIRVQKLEYAAIRNVAEQNGLQVYNATPGGYLESFQRKPYTELFQ